MAHKNIHVKKIILFALILAFLFSADFALALEMNYPKLPGAQTPQDFLKTAPPQDQLGLWVKYIINFLMWASGLIALLSLIWAGIVFLTSAGKPERIVAARQRVLGAFLGLAIILSSYFVLEIINPLFLNFTLSDITKIPETPKLPALPSQNQDSTVNVYVPVIRIVENIFQTYISNPEEAEIKEVDGKEQSYVPETLTRIQRINNNLDAIQPLLPPILTTSNKLFDLSKKCKCHSKTKPDPRCNSCGQCLTIFCNSDPCSTVRSDIVQTETEYPPYLFGNIEGVIQHDASGQIVTISTNLTKELEKTKEEIRLLKYWFEKLSRAEKFIKECDWPTLNNMNQYFLTKEVFEAKGWVANEASFWDDISLTFNKPVSPQSPQSPQERWHPTPGTLLKETVDESALYCPVGGTYSPDPVYFETAPEWGEELEKIKDMGEKEAGEFLDEFSYEIACDVNIPYGELLDKAHRMTRLLINKLEIIVDRGEKMLESIENLQTLISRCSSAMCFPVCIPCTSTTPCFELGCFGPACPREDIANEIKNIRLYNQEINNAMDGSKNSVGIRYLINVLSTDLLEGMEKTLRVRLPSPRCIYEKVGADMAFWPCPQVLGGTDQIGKMIRQCMIGTNEEWQDSLYGGCLNTCLANKLSQTKIGAYTKTFEQSDYYQCLKECMGWACIYNFYHELDFFCCHTKL